MAFSLFLSSRVVDCGDGIDIGMFPQAATALRALPVTTVASYFLWGQWQKRSLWQWWQGHSPWQRW